jgi:pantoate--beta-alanine ligase
MLVFKKLTELENHLATISGSLGFVPTMGALHAGHISLLEQSEKENEQSVCSIFVNPLQFNNANDLEKYPRDLEADIKMLEPAGCDILFAPSPKEIYRDEKDKTLDFDPGFLDTLFEGALRPGHFKGVAVVVNRLFGIIKPTNAYFGLKDYQQCMLIKKLVHDLAIPVNLHFCPTLREKDGLAMSSRNVRLSAEARKVATKIYEVLQYAHEHYRTQNITMIEDWCKSQLSATPLYRVEYFNIVNAETLLPLNTKNEPAVALCAAFVDGVRLIDNMVLN